MTRRIAAWAAPFPALRRWQEQLLNRQLSELWERSDFLRALWEAAGFKNAPVAGDLGELPLVAKDDIRRSLEAGFLGSHLAWPRDGVAHIHATAGTSGRPTYFGLSARDYAAWLEIFVRGFQLCGAKPGDLVLQAFAMSRGYAGGVPMVDAFRSMGCPVLPMGAESGSARLCDALHRLRPILLYASPSMSRHLADRFAEETGEQSQSSSLRLIITGGEPGAGDPASKRILGEPWGAEVREAGGGSDICPLMWAECPVQDGLHFVAGDEVLFELIDPGSGQPIEIEDDASGEIVYTHLRRDASPLVRMRHADIVTVSTSLCPCGLGSPRIKFVGRADDMLIVRGVKIFPSALQAVVSQFAPRLSGALAIRRSRSLAQEGPLRVVCEWDEGDGGDALSASFEERARALLGVRVRCELTPPGSLGQEGQQKAVWMLDD